MENTPTKHRMWPTERSSSVEKLNDIGFRIIFIPFFGIVIPLVTGMFEGHALSRWQFKFSFAYSIGIALVIWQGNRYLLFTLRSYFDWFNKPVRKIISLLLAVSFFTIPISALLLAGWYYIFAEGTINRPIIFTSTLIIMICVIFIIHVYETVFLVRDSETELLRREQLEKARSQAELEALRNQVDPHFIFNSLNTLSHLIEQNPVKAKQFNDSMADVFRYILQNKGRNLVLLREEMLFLYDYFILLQIRFEQAVQLCIQIDPAVYDHYLVPPISLQILLENAIKHNEFSDDAPLIIQISLQDEALVVCHERRDKTSRKPSSRIGLQNLEERCKLITDKSIRVRENGQEFSVTVPLLIIA